jgi:hypothetical protein
MKNFKEQEVKDLSTINGGITTVEVKTTVNWKGWCDGSLFRGEGINEFDETTVSTKFNPTIKIGNVQIS